MAKHCYDEQVTRPIRNYTNGFLNGQGCCVGGWDSGPGSTMCTYTLQVINGYCSVPGPF